MQTTQDPTKRKKLHDYLSKEGMTPLDFDTFSTEYASDEKKLGKLYDYLSQEGMTPLSKEDFTSQYFGDVKKKDASDSSGTNTNEDSAPETESGSLDTSQDDRGQLVKDVEAGKLDDRIDELQAENNAVATEDEQRLNSLLERYKQDTSFNTADFETINETVEKENRGNFGFLQTVSDFAAQAWTGQKPLSPKEIAINKITDRIAKEQGINVADVNRDDAEQEYIASRKKELSDATKEAKTTEFISDLSEEDKRVLTNHFSIEAGKLDAKNTSRLIEGKALAKDIQDIDKKLSEIEANYNSNQEYPLEYYKNNQQLQAQREQLKQNLNTVVTELGEDETNLLSTKEELDLFKRNYDTWENFSGKLGIAGEEMLVDFGYLMNKINQVNPLISDEQFESSEEGAIAVKEKLNKERQGLRKNISVSDINSSGDLTNWALDLVAEQAPQTALMVTTGGTSLPLMGATAAGSKLYDIEEEERLGIAEYTDLQKYGSVAISGIVEPLSEKISLGQINKAKRVFSSMAKKELKDNTVDWLKRSFPEYVKDILEEGGSEAVAQLAENISDKYLLGKDVNLTEGLDDAFVSGAFMSGAVYKLPGLAPRFIPKDVNQKIGENSNKIVAFNQQLQKELSPEVKQSIEKQRDNLLNDNDALLSKSFDKLDQLSKEDKTKLLSLENSIYNTRKEAKTINEEVNLDEATKKTLIAEAAKTIDNLNQQKDQILNAKTQQDTKETQEQKVEVTTPETEVESEKGLVYSGQSILKEELKKINAPQKIIDAISNDTKLRSSFLTDTSSIAETIKSIMGVRGSFSQSENTIRIGNFYSYIFGGRKDLLLHEAVHAATISTVKDVFKNPNDYTKDQYKAVEDLNEIAFDYMINNPTTAKLVDPLIYGTSDTYEFIAEFISNKKFREWIGRNDQNKTRNNIQHIWDRILQVLGIYKNDINKDRISRISSLIDKTLDISIDRLNKARYKNEKQAQGDTVTNGDVQSGTAPNLQQQQVEDVQTTVNDGTSESKVEVKRINPKGVKGEFDVTFNEQGTVTKIQGKDGREVPKFIERKVKATKDNPSGKKLVRNGNYSKIVAEATGGITENQATEERKKKVSESLESYTPNDAYSHALDYLARGGNVSLESAKKETGLTDKEVRWATGFKKDADLPSVEAAAENIIANTEQELDIQEVRDVLIDVIKSNKGVNQVEDAIISEVDSVKQEQQEQQEAELEAYKNSLTEEELANLEAIEAEDSYISELSDQEALEYYEQYYGKQEQNQDVEIGTPKTSSVQERTGEEKNTPEEKITPNDDVQSQGISLSKENNRDSALSKEGAVKSKNARQRKFKRFWRQTFSSSRGLDRKVVRAVESLMGELSAIDTALKFEASQFAKMSNTIKKQGAKLYNERLKEINDYLSGVKGADVSFLNTTQQDQLDAFRGRIDTLSDKIIDVLEDKKSRLKTDEAIERVDALIETIEDNKGKYMFRQYDAFSNDSYLDDLTSKHPNNAARKRLDDAIDFVVAEDGVTRDEAETQILDYLDGLKGANNFVTASSSGKAKAPFLKKRKGIPEPIRALLGESKDPVKNYTATVLNMSTYVANLEYQSRLIDTLDNLGLVSETMKPGYTRLAKSKEGWDLLQDAYVPNEVAEGIEDLQPLDSIQDGAYKILVRLSAYTKLGKTVLAPQTMARNFLSGVFLSLNGGFNPFLNPKRFAQGIAHSWGTKKTQTNLRKENQRLIKLGVINDGAVSKEVMGILNDAKLPIDKLLNKNVAEQFLDVMQKLYAMGDDSYKVVGFYVWEGRYKRAGFNDAMAEELAAERVRNGFPTYSKIPKNIQKLRRIPLIGTFPSFTYEVWRTNYNNIKYIGQDLKAANDKSLSKGHRMVRAEMAFHQIAGMAVATSMAYALSTLSKSILGISDEEDETTKNMSPEWQKDSTNIYVGKQGNNYEVIDATAFFPQETLLKPLRILTEEREGRDINDKTALSLKAATDAFFSTDIFMKTLEELHMNINNYGQPIYEGENILEGLSNNPDKITNYVLRQAGPGLYNNISEFARANEIAPDFFGEKETSYKEYTNTEAALALIGIRLSRINYANGINSLAYDAKDKYREARSNLLRHVKSSRDIPEKDMQSLVMEYAKKNKAINEQIILAITGAKKQGMTEATIKSALKSAGYSGTDIDALFKGQAPALKPVSKATIKNKNLKLDIGRHSKDKAKLKQEKEKIITKANLLNKIIKDYNKKATTN